MDLMFIPLTQGQVAIIDDEDWPIVKEYKWHTNKIADIYYAASTIRKESGKQTVLFMHRLLMGEPKMLIDHKNGDGLDNRKENLRVASCKQNAMNQKSNGGASKYKGVTFHKRDKYWQASIVIDGSLKYLGSFKNEEEAAKAYNKAAVEHFGEFARLNVLNGGLW